MTEQKLTVGYITDLKDVDWLLLSLESVEAIADEIIIIEDGHNPQYYDILDKWVDKKDKYKIIHNKYPGNNGLQYNQVLKYATGDWILILDSDEVIDDNAHLLREYMNKDKTIYNIKMIHCINDLVHVDATQAGAPQYDPEYVHHVPMRFYKNKKGIFYPNAEHCVIQGFTEEDMGVIDDVTIWHYGRAKAMMQHKQKYEMNMKRSNIHDKDFLRWWYMTGVTSQYPVRVLKDLKEHPSVVRREFYL